jgi:hypothetical protein
MDTPALSPTLSNASTTGSTNSRFKTIKKKIKSTFKGKQRASLAEVDQVLKRSIEFEDELGKQQHDSDKDTLVEGEADLQSASIIQFQTEFKGEN